ncbi:MAG: OB-fold domain-containing protein [Verrucomicrobiota bacterium]
MSGRLEHPSLYQASDGAPLLAGCRCAACGYVGFPFQNFGCEKCGAADLAPTQLRARGTLVSFAQVHRHAGKDIAAPFAIGEIRLDDGPLIRCTLASNAQAQRIGQIMVGVLEHNPASEPDVRELRFEAERT